MKWILGVGAFILAPIALTASGVGGSSASAQVVNYSQAVAAINQACASGLRMAHSVYGSNPSLNMTTGVVTFTTNLLWKRCAAGTVGEYAVTGYSYNACPIVGMYHNGSVPTQDCLKYSNRHNTMPNCGGFRCIYRATWNGYGIYKGADGGPGDYNLRHATISSRTAQISNWSTKRQTSGSEAVYVDRMCDYYSGRSDYLCVNAYVQVSWTGVGWALRGETYAKASPGMPSDGVVRYQGRNALTAVPGQTVYWDHDLRNQGPANMGVDVRININRTDFSLASGAQVRSSFNPSNIVRRGTANELFYVNNNIAYTITQNNVGERLCQRLQWTPGSSSNSAMMHSNTLALSNPRGAIDWTCVSVPFNYTLVPTINNVSHGSVVDSNDAPFQVTGSVQNQGPTKSLTNVRWQLTQVEYTTPITSIPRRTGGPGADPCAYFTGSVACNEVSSGNEAAGYSFPGSGSYNGMGDLANKPAGTKVCFALSVQKYTPTASNWTHSALQCIVVGKKPKVQIHAGDLFVGRGSATNGSSTSDVITSTSSESGRNYGSWAEYAIIPTGCVSGMASGSGYAGGATTNILSSLSILTFTSPSSTSCPNNIGRYTLDSIAPNVASRFPINITAAEATPSAPADPRVLPGSTVTLSSLSRTYQAPEGVTNISVSGGSDIAPRQWVVINAPDATVTITDNIRYTTSALSNLEDIPQVVIIANNIIIENDVRQIDAWLVATGSGANGIINTCGAGSGVGRDTPLTVNICNQQLVVNGPVMANHLHLRRTHGAESGDMGRPAEIFNLRADAYLWATSYNLNTGRLSTVDTKELPPRF